VRLEMVNREKIIRHAVDELIAKGNLGVVDEIFASDYVAHTGDKAYHGNSFIKSVHP
jgi:hypothetical protein